VIARSKPATENGDTAKKIVIKDDYRYSEALRIDLIIQDSDPLTGTVKMTVAQVTRPIPLSLGFPRAAPSWRQTGNQAVVALFALTHGGL
jgi:hypothetical protein